MLHINHLLSGTGKLRTLQQEIVGCQRCSRLIHHCQEVAQTKRRAYIDWEYWGKPVPSFGVGTARLLVIGLAPGAHGANRTGRMFTGDRSGDFLYRAMYNAGFASQPDSREAGDGLTLQDAWITAPGHCAPPDNKPSPEELRACRPFLERELELLSNVRVVVALGKIAFDSYLGVLKSRGQIGRLSEFRFGHGALYDDLQPALLASYHPSQQNTSTGKLTQAMLDDIFLTAARIIRSEPAPAGPRP
jgi:uracil-DNA glycosylase family 4